MNKKCLMLYEQIIGNKQYNNKFNDQVFNGLQACFCLSNIDLSEFWNSRKVIIKKIKERIKANIDSIWSQPVIFLLYPLIKLYRKEVIDIMGRGFLYPDLEKMYVDLGIPYESR